MVLPSQNVVRVLAALHKNSITVPAIGQALGQQDLKTLGAAANGYYDIDYFAPLTSNAPGVARFKKEMGQYAPSALLDNYSLLAWFGVHMFTDVAATLPSITRASVLDAWNHAVNLNTYGLIPPYTTTKPYTGFGGAFPRAFNNTYWLEQVRDGQPYLIADKPVAVQ